MLPNNLSLFQTKNQQDLRENKEELERKARIINIERWCSGLTRLEHIPFSHVFISNKVLHLIS
jgi:hypothetical protein